MTEPLFNAIRELVFVGTYPNIEDAQEAVDAFVEDNRIPVSEDGFVDYLNYMDIIRELKG